ncbi:DUF4350 domain-containing protein [Hymenobacter perfusus]|uniref:DUF4350 domain-containing protein n=1 Tax=Hymenobacter perfusus TaxID=1236770 RepID=A0A3R9V307_9BACT|nr:DUF4350 domain-containing protein [Hymenobacter perfusus]RSK45658.1 hypothetical protein EI293_00345 [Hymenobacter perfusus]
MTTFRWYMLGLGLLFAAYVAVEYYRPKPLDWSPTLQNEDKIPYGTYVLFDQLPGMLGVPRADVRTVRAPIYSQIEGVDEDDLPATAVTDSATSAAAAERDELIEQLDSVTNGTPADSAATTAAGTPKTPPANTEQPNEGQPTDNDDRDYAAGLSDGDYQPATYLFVANSFELSRQDCRSLLRHIARGNDVLIAAENFDSFFADTVGFKTSVYTPSIKLRKTSAKALLANDSVRLQFSNPTLATKAGVRLPLLAASSRLQAKQNIADKATQLATDEQGQPVLLRVPHGRGHLYLCSVPLAFSNYYLLQPRTSNFAFSSLSYLPTGRTVWWDEYQKQGRRGEQSLLRVLLEHEALRYAMYLTLAVAILFVGIEARRRQRVIPILKPLPNTTLLFTRTVAGLYRQGSSHALIAEKKIGLFLEHLRTRYHEPALDLTDADTRERLSQKSGVARQEIDALVRRINFLLTAPQISDTELLNLNKAILAFRQTAA